MWGLLQENVDEDEDAVPFDIDARQLLRQAKADGIERRDFIAALIDPEFENE